MNFILWLIVGGVVGWLASLIMRTDAQQGIVLNIVVGIVGAFIGNWLFPQLGFAMEYPIGAIVSATVGAILLLFVIGLIRRVA